MPKLRTYYTLLQFRDGQWCPEFGDYDKAVVEAELDDYRDHFILKKHLKIVTTKGHKMADLQVILDGLNAWVVTA